ncbi:hypothetical protein M8818_001135 [Zalaria obscura]|uniref:Uncharacterized protein n=1 Tax=Zalaria obscura TaxID=2024903 RepID=A0ACC3SLP7_9PEZI
MANPKSPSSSDAAPDLSILGNRLTILPPGVSSAPELPHDPETSPEQPLLTSYARFRSSPIDFLREVSLHVSGTGWRSYDTFIGQDIFYNGFSERMRGMVMQSPQLLRKIEELAKRRVDVEISEGMFKAERNAGNAGMTSEKRRREIEGQLKEVAADWTDKMICKMESRRFIRGAYYLCTQLVTRAYHQGIHVSSEEVLRLRAVAEQAAKKNQSIIFLPCHRSHVDYVSLQLICYRLGLALPTVVAGDNLNFPVVGPFLQHAGAMWIRRSFGEDALYTTLVQSYIDTLLQNGYNFECFVEGGRSRTGKLLQPKFGILSFLLDSVLSGRVKDAIICPVSTQYDKVIEVDSYISELLGQPKPKESLFSFLSSSSILSLKLGRVDVRFHEPWSLRAFVEEQRSRIGSLPRQMDTSYDTTLKRRLLTTLGYKVLADINAVSVVMPTALIGTVLLTLRGRGVGKAELVRRVEWLCERVRGQGGRVAHFGGLPTATVVERGLEVLGPNLVGVVEGLPEPTYYAVDRFQLSFYRNMTIHLFVSEALVSAAMYTKVKRGGGPENQKMGYQELYDYTFFLSQLFRAEFIFPTMPLADNLSKTLQGLETDDVITTTQDRDGKVSTIELSASERARGQENFDFYCFLIWPFIEATWLGAVSLLMLTPPATGPSLSPSATKQSGSEWLDLKQVQDRAQLLGKTLYHQGDLSYFEAVNKETLKNAYTRFEEEGIISVSRSRDSKVPAKVRLDKEWMPVRDAQRAIKAEGKLWEFCESISRSRREGKNRRDGATVRGRVLGLVELVGGPLWEVAGAEGRSSGLVEGEERKRRARRKPMQTKARL